MWSDESRGFVDDVNGFNFVDAWPMIIVIPCVEIHFEPRFFAGIQMGTIWTDAKAVLLFPCCFVHYVYLVSKKTRVNLWRSLIFVARFPTLNPPLKKRLMCAVFKFATGIKIHSKISNLTWYTIADTLTKFCYKTSNTFSFPSTVAVVNWFFCWHQNLFFPKQPTLVGDLRVPPPNATLTPETRPLWRDD